MQGRLDKGEFNSSATRVLHYVLNPEAEARREQQQACIAELKSEVALLKTQLQHEWDKGPQGSTGEGLPSAGVAALEAEITVLNQKVKACIPSPGASNALAGSAFTLPDEGERLPSCSQRVCSHAAK